MDEDYTYDEMCPEEAEFLYYEGGESYADDDYDDLDDYDYQNEYNHVNHHNSDLTHNAAMLGAAYMAGRSYSRRRDIEWERSMAKYRKKWHDDKTGVKPIKRVPKKRILDSTPGDIAAFCVAVVIFALIASLLIGFIVWPILHIFFFCDDFMCGHHPTFGFTGVMVCTAVIAGFIGLLFLVDEGSK